MRGATASTRYRRGRRTRVRTDSGGGTHVSVEWLAKQGRWLSYSVVGMTITGQNHPSVLTAPPSAWTPAVGPGGSGVFVVDATDGGNLRVLTDRPVTLTDWLAN